MEPSPYWPSPLVARKEGSVLTLEILDVIGPSWAGMIDAQSVSRALQDAGQVGEIVVLINSPGGDVSEGVSIYNLLKQHSATKTVKILGLAASIASVVSCAGDVVEMPPSALMMIHPPWSITIGDASDHRKTAEMLDKMRDSIAAVYAEKSGRPAAEFLPLMEAETWFNAAEAIEIGLADQVDEQAPAAKALRPAPISFASKFRHMPQTAAALLRPQPPEEGPMADAKKTEEPKKDAAASATTEAAAKPEPKAEAKAEPAQNAAPAVTPADVEKARTEGAQNEIKRQSDIRALCSQAGMPEKADHFCNDAKASLDDVRSHLFDAMCKRNSPPPDNAAGDPAASGDKKDPHAAFRKEFAENKAALARVGVNSEDAYVRSRCKDEGIDPPAKAA
jgi:ATP-dependent protease ClpP protease subunit